MAAYTAYLNNSIFFATNIHLDKVKLLSTTVELEAGASGEFVFTIPPCNLAYGHIHKKIDDIEVYEGSNLIFAGRPYYIKQDFKLNHVIKCEGYLTILNDTVIRPFTYSGTLTGLIEEFQRQHNAQVGPDKQFQIGNITVTDRNDYLTREYTSYAKTNDRLKDLVTVYGGYPIIRKENGTLYFDWIESFTEESNQEIKLKKNILDVTQVEDSAGIVTVLIPLGAEIEDEVTGEKSRLTIKSVNGGRDYIENATGISQFGIIVDYHIWDDVTTAAQLYRKGNEWLQENSQQKLQISISTVDLADAGYNVDNYKIGQKLRVTATPHGITRRWFTCLKLRFDLLQPGQKNLTMESVVAGYIKTTRDAQDQYNRLIEKVVSNYVTNTALSNISTQLNQRIEYNTTLIEQNAQAIALKADASVVDGLGTRIAAAEAEITIQAGEIALKADMSTVTALGTRVTQAEADIDAAEAAITLKADQTVVNGLSTRVTQAEADIDAAEAAIALKASQTDLTALGTRVTAAEADIDANTAAITLKASQSDLTALSGRVTQAEADIDANAAAIALKASQTDLTALGTRVTQAEADIDAAEAAIALKASQSDVTALGTRVTQAEADINAAEGEISLKVSTSDYTGANIASLINQSASTVVINAAHINLAGSLTIGDFSSAAKTAIVSNVESVTEYYLSDVDSGLIGGSWSTTIPAWTSGKYLFVRTKTTKVDAAGTISTTETSETYDQNLTKALSDAATAVSTANSASALATGLDGSIPIVNLLPGNYWAENRYGSTWTNNGITWTVYWDGTIKATGTATDNSWFYLTGNIMNTDVPVLTVDDEKDYVLSGCPSGGGNTKYMLIAQATQEGTTPSGSSGTIYTDTGSGVAITNKPMYICVIAGIASGYTCPSGGITFKPMLEVGNKKHKYVSTHIGIGALQDKTVQSTAQCYYRSTTSTAPTISASTSIGTAEDTSNAWEYVMPRPKKNCYFFTCEKYTYADGSVSFSTVRHMANITYSSLWCNANDATCIDGAAIYTGSITAAKIDVQDLFSQAITATNLTITGGSINMETDNNSSYITMYNGLTSTVGLKTEIGANKIVKSGYANGAKQVESIMSSSGVRANSYMTGSGTSSSVQQYTELTYNHIYTDGYIQAEGKGTFGALNSGLFKIKQVTVLNQQSLAGDAYSGASVTFTPDTGYTAIGIAGWAVTTTDGGNYARYMNVWALRLASATQIYYSICNTGTNTRTVTLYAYVLELKTTA